MKYNDSIAIFMGGSILNSKQYMMPHGANHEVTINNWKIPHGLGFSSQELAKIGNFDYHCNWNSIMSVIDYIETLEIEDENFRFVFYKNVCIIEAQMSCFKPSDMWHVHMKVEGKNKIDAAYNAVGELILSFKK